MRNQFRYAGPQPCGGPATDSWSAAARLLAPHEHRSWNRNERERTRWMRTHGKRRAAATTGMLLVLSACGTMGPTRSVDFDFDFAAGPQAWVAGFADYRPGDEAFLELESGYRRLPARLGPEMALYISGHNRSDDLFMFFWRRVDGLRSATAYAATFTVEIATDVPRGCGGIGGSPGESVFLKAGAAPIEPVTRVDAGGMLRLAVDHGNQSGNGRHAVVLGTIENATPCELGVRRWERKLLASVDAALTVETDALGSLWLIVGTDSGFEGSTSLFYTGFTVRLDPL